MTDQDSTVTNELLPEEEVSAASTSWDDTQSTIAQLQKQLAEMTAIAKRAQSDYFMLKMDFDWYSQRHEAQKEQMKEENLISLIKRLIPVVNTLKQMVQTVPADLRDNTWVQGVILTEQKLLTELDTMNVKVIYAELGTEPDLYKHIPLSTQEGDKASSGKIVKVLEDGYLYQWKEKETVIIPAKVVVWI